MTEKILHTEMVEAIYGPVTIYIVEQSEQRRIINMLDREDRCRTHAITWFPHEKPGELLNDIRIRVREGEGVGLVVNSLGWNINKKRIFSGEIVPPEWIKMLLNEERAGINLYDFIVEIGTKSEYYGTILEIFPAKILQNNFLSTDASHDDMNKRLEALKYIYG